MTPGCLRRCSVWLLPFLAARMLVPVGFMLSLSGGGLDIVLCTGFAPALAAGAVQIGHQHHALLGHTAHSDPPAPLPRQGSEHSDHAGPIFHSPWREARSLRRSARASTSRGVSSRYCPARATIQSDCARRLIDRIRGPPLA